MKITEQQIKSFHKDGYLHLKKFFTDEEVQNLIQACRKKLPGDTATHEEFNGVTLSKKVVSVLKQLVGEEILYPGLSFARTGDIPDKIGSRGFHSDAAYETNDFSYEYPVVNTGIYLQDHKHHSGGLKLVPRSHTRPCFYTRTIPEAIKKIIKALLKRDFKKAFAIINLHPSINIENEPGDFLVWSMRIHHSGYARRVRIFNKISFHPLFEDILPSFLFLKENPERDVILTVYATPGEIFNEYMKIQKRKFHRKDHFLASNLDKNTIAQLAKEVGVILKNDGHEYAADPNSTFQYRGKTGVSGKPGLKK